MKILIKIEEMLLVVLAYYLFQSLDYAWWWFFVLFLAPDLSMLGYLGGKWFGAFTYNLAHHKGVAIGVFLLGLTLNLQPLQLAGLVMFGHSSFDRIFDYGLKYPDSFKHTHLGTIRNVEA